MTTQQSDQAKTEAFVGRLFKGSIEALDLLSIYVGDRLGLYRVLSQSGSLTASQLARGARINERYAREWLEQQAVTGILEVDNASLPDNQRKYMLPAAHGAALTDLDSPFSMSPLARFIVVAGKVMPDLLNAYRSGGGVSWSDYGPDAIEAQGDFNRPWIMHTFGTEILPAIKDVHTRLQANPPARVLDVACGVGWSSIAIAKAYPKATVHGLDLDQSSIEIARKNAADAGVANRVTFESRDVATLSSREPYDIAVVIEAVHDMSNPVQVLESVRRVLSPGGTMIVADERVADKFTVPGDDMERLYYGASILFCLPNGMADQPSAATGTVMRASTLKRYATQAGFREVQVLDVEHPTLRFYRLVP